MNDTPDAMTIAVIIAAFLIGYAVVSFLVARLKPSKPQSTGDTSASKEADQRAQDASRQWEERRRQQEEELQRQEEIRREQEREHARQEEERRREQEEARSRSSAGAQSRVKDEKYYGNILGLRGHVTPDDVRKRYRHLVAQYHPDKVNHLGPKLRELAEKEMKELNEAFEFFKRRYG
jgi:hypothetical protein